MVKQGETRKERQWIRRDFEKYGRLSVEVQKAILKDIYGVEE
jgi:recombinational DNA repair protein RecT